MTLTKETREFTALCSFFAILGILFASWAARIPAIRDFSALTTATLTIALLGRGAGSVLIYPVIAGFVTKYGAKNTALWSGLLLILSLPSLAIFPNFIILTAILAAQGALTSVFNIAINALAGEFEKRVSSSKMSMIHAWFSVGTVTGASLSSLAEWIEMGPFTHFALIAVISAIALKFALNEIQPSEVSVVSSRFNFVLPKGEFLVLGMIGFLAAITESSISNWVTLYFKDYIKSSMAIAPMGFLAYSASMFLGRLTGDYFKNKYGARKVVMSGTLLASVAMTSVVLTQNMWIAMIGFGITGFGLATVFPFLFSASARNGSVQLASVATLGYMGGLIAPNLMGFLIERWDMAFAMGLMVISSLLISVLASRSKLIDAR